MSLNIFLQLNISGCQMYYIVSTNIQLAKSNQMAVSKIRGHKSTLSLWWEELQSHMGKNMDAGRGATYINFL